MSRQEREIERAEMQIRKRKLSSQIGSMRIFFLRCCFALCYCFLHYADDGGKGDDSMLVMGY